MATIVGAEDDVATLQSSTTISGVSSNPPPSAPINKAVSIEPLFSSGIYRCAAPEFLPEIKLVFKDAIAEIKKHFPLITKSVYPVLQSANIYDDPRIAKFTEFIGQTAWGILNNQGYNMDAYHMFFNDMWCQEHHKYSGHDTHTHPNSAITGFYIIEVPENSCRIVFKDPRSAKYHSNLMERDISQASMASNEINYGPAAGDCFFTNSWLPHSFTRNGNMKPFKMIHFDLGVKWADGPLPTQTQTRQ